MAMAEEADILERVEAALARGEVWRAKEILRGNIGSRGYSPRLYERYGRLLLELGDKYEAGKYLFLSAQRHAEYEDATSLYLGRVAKCHPQAIAWSFPKGARLEKLSSYPEPLRSELARMGFRGGTRRIVAPLPPTTLGDQLRLLGCAVLALVVIGAAILGIKSLFQGR